MQRKTKDKVILRQSILHQLVQRDENDISSLFLYTILFQGSPHSQEQHPYENSAVWRVALAAGLSMSSPPLAFWTQTHGQQREHQGGLLVSSKILRNHLRRKCYRLSTLLQFQIK